MAMHHDPTQDESQSASSGFSRRLFLQVAGVAGAGAVMADPILRRAEAAPAAEPAGKVISGATPIKLTINGQERSVTVEPRDTLLTALRDLLDPPITGPKLVCNGGTCGACSVLLDGKPAYGCSVLAIDAVGRTITTVEGIGTPDHLNAVQAAFIEKDAMMCGFCTSGFVTVLTALLEKNPNPTPDQVREGCHGNFCRCGTYPHIFQAVEAASKMSKT
jgi:xanthine dehydrogenase YagT iron-sulfur-binding subunit